MIRKIGKTLVGLGVLLFALILVVIFAAIAVWLTENILILQILSFIAAGIVAGYFILYLAYIIGSDIVDG